MKNGSGWQESLDGGHAPIRRPTPETPTELEVRRLRARMQALEAEAEAARADLRSLARVVRACGDIGPTARALLTEIEAEG